MGPYTAGVKAMFIAKAVRLGRAYLFVNKLEGTGGTLVALYRFSSEVSELHPNECLHLEVCPTTDLIRALECIFAQKSASNGPFVA